MRPLSNSLLRAQRSSSSKPWVRVEALDRMAGIARLRFERLHTGSEAEGPHALTFPADGALIRARVDPTNSHNLYVQRVSNPSATSDFTQLDLIGPGVQGRRRGPLLCRDWTCSCSRCPATGAPYTFGPAPTAERPSGRPSM